MLQRWLVVLVGLPLLLAALLTVPGLGNGDCGVRHRRRRGL